MNRHLVYFDRTPAAVSGFRSAVSLHSHTLHSKESGLPPGRLRKIVG